MYDKYPYTDFHEMNLDWIIKEMKELVDAWDSYGTAVTAEAHTSSDPEVTVTGDLKEGLNFDFGLVQGPRGTTGPQGPQGEQGPAGNGLEILDIYPTLAALQAAHPTGSPGDAYLVGSGGNYTLYIWSTSAGAWSDGGALTSPTPSSGTPIMDGVGSAGSSLLYSREDHVHPADTSKLDKSSSDGVYAVESGAQVMLAVSDNALADALVQYDSVGDLNAGNLNASGDISAVDGTFSGDVAVTGDISCDEINVTTNAILNSQMLAAEVSTNAYRPMATVNPIDPLTLTYDIATNIPSLKFNAVAYDSSGNRNTLAPEVKFTDGFKVNTTDYAETRIGLSPATANSLGAIKVGNNLSIDSNGVLSATGGGSGFYLAWTNPDSTASFAAQTINIDFSDATFVYVLFRKSNSSGPSYVPVLALPNYETFNASAAGTGSTNNAFYREFSITENGITFEAGHYNGSNSNAYMIPAYIYKWINF